uniref:hypothetical protein n=1 Tax=Nocardia suismassiliense TaxID=2077092 RepID=UPI003F49072F
MEAAGHPEFFATVTQARRKELGLTMAGLRRAGGPAVPTLVAAEAGNLRNPQSATFTKYDEGLQWEPESAARAFWKAEQPVPLEARRPAAAPLRLGDGMVVVPLERVLALMGVQQDLHAATEGAGTIPAATVQQIAARFDRELSYVVGAAVTDMLERNRERDAAHPGLELALADALAAPVDGSDPDAEERWYRRWLLGGVAAAGIDEQLRAKFESRYQARQGGDDDR